MKNFYSRHFLIAFSFQGNKERIFLEPGQMVIYESARVPHGRQEPLDGQFFDNLFVHFYPAKIWYKNEFDIEDLPERKFKKKDLI